MPGVNLNPRNCPQGGPKVARTRFVVEQAVPLKPGAFLMHSSIRDKRKQIRELFQTVSRAGTRKKLPIVDPMELEFELDT